MMYFKITAILTIMLVTSHPARLAGVLVSGESFSTLRQPVLTIEVGLIPVHVHWVAVTRMSIRDPRAVAGVRAEGVVSLYLVGFAFEGRSALTAVELVGFDFPILSATINTAEPSFIYLRWFHFVLVATLLTDDSFVSTVPWGVVLTNPILSFELLFTLLITEVIIKIKERLRNPDIVTTPCTCPFFPVFLEFCRAFTWTEVILVFVDTRRIFFEFVPTFITVDLDTHLISPRIV
jgi:hypothetical protein